MGSPKRRSIWKNEYFQTALTIAITIIVVFGLWIAAQNVLRTSNPVLAVVSQSMLPTLNIGDDIILQGATPDQINAAPITGDIVVFRSGETSIVHRAIAKSYSNSTGKWTFTTRGDNNPPGATETWTGDRLVGKVIGKIPWVGNLALLSQSLGGDYFVILFILIVIIIFVLLIPSGKKEETPGEEERKESRKLFGKLGMPQLYAIIVNIILLAILFFGFFGSLTFWQPGAVGPQFVTVYGEYSDLQWFSSFTKIAYNNITQAYLYNGFFTYQINAQVDSSIRPGVPAFAWWQIALLVLVIFDAWILFKFYRNRNRSEELNIESEH